MMIVCWADVSCLDDSADYELSAYRMEKLQHLHKPEARRLSIGVELLLQKALKKARPEYPMPPVILCDDGGKPFFSNRAYSFNLSHSGVYAACALSDRPVGIDLQIPVKAQERLIKRALTPNEAEYLNAAENRDDAFTELWCRKESFLKATGEGLAGGLQSFCSAPGHERLLYQEEEFEIFHRRFPRFHLAVCCPKPISDEIIVEKIELP